jgi:hypothetical protein
MGVAHRRTVPQPQSCQRRVGGVTRRKRPAVLMNTTASVRHTRLTPSDISVHSATENQYCKL